MYRPTSRNAFTLVELLVTVVIIGVISGMLSIALSGAQRQAQQTRTRAFINRLNLLVLDIYEQESERRFPISSRSVNSTNRNWRNWTQLMWKRDWLRAALPDRIHDVDIDLDPGSVWDSPRRSKPIQHLAFVPNPTPPPPFIQGQETIDPSTLGPYTTRDARTARYQSRIIRTYIALGQIDPTNTATDEPHEQWNVVTGGAATGTGLWSVDHQSAECLYLILATHTVNGAPASDSLRSRDIADTDGDGMPEVVDSWGIPVAFMRWPVGFYLTSRWNDPPTNVELAEIKQRLGRDPLDVLYSDPRYHVGASPPLYHEAEDPFALVPVVVSAGGDREFDLVGIDNPTSDIGVTNTDLQKVVNYKAMRQPVPVGLYTNPFFATDPYLGLIAGTTPSSYRPIEDQIGARMDTDSDGTDDSGDNIVPALSFIQ